MKRLLVILCCLFLVGGLVAGCGSQNAADNSLVVGCTVVPHAEIMQVVKPMLAEQGIELEIKVFTDYVLLNPALKDKQIDANFFQHIPYLEDYNTKNNADLVWIAKVHNEPMGVYSNKYDSIDKVEKGARIGIPNDATNGGRALMVLEAAGLLELKEGVGVTATDRDIVKNPLQLDIEAQDAAMLPRSLEDLDVCVINSNYALEANLNPVEDSIFMEPKDSPFANVLVVRPEDKDNEAIKKLAAALQSEEVRQFLEETYKGACVPAF